MPANPKAEDDEAAEKQEKKDKKLLKIKLPAPKDGWLDKKRYRHAFLSRQTPPVPSLF